MSRLQVGGLALTLDSKIQIDNVGLVVNIVEMMPNRYGDGVDWYKVTNDGLKSRLGAIIGYGKFPSFKLMPLGDDQTQAEFRKELDELVF